MNEIEEILAHFGRQRRWTRAVIAAIPEERFEWRPSESSFGCGDLVRHLIQAEVFWRRMFAAAVAGLDYDPLDLDGNAEERMLEFRPRNLEAGRSPRLGSSFEECLTAWERVQAETETFLGELSSEQLATVRVRHPITGLEASLREMLMIMCEHEAYHRGQLAGYARVLGVELPATQWT